MPAPDTIPGPDNQVDAGVGGRLTELLDRTVARRSIHHAMFAVAAGAADAEGAG